MYKSVTDRYYNEVLSDNSNAGYCAQCKDCVRWGNGDAFSNRHFKSNCDAYIYPACKPTFVINNTGDCEFRRVENG